MKTLKTKQIDGIKIITGFDILPIDPKATQKTCLPIIDKLPESDEARNKQTAFRAAYAKARNYKNESIGIYKHIAEQIKAADPKKVITRDLVLNSMLPAVKKGFLNSEELMRNHKAQCNIIQEEMKEIGTRLNAKAKEVLRGNPVYFECRLNEEKRTTVEVDDLLTKFLAKDQNQQLKDDGTFIDDFRGKFYNQKIGSEWIRAGITKIGKTKLNGSKFDEELTEIEKTEIADQKEIERVGGLTAEDKAAEKQARLDSVLAESITMRSGFEIQGDSVSVAKTKATDWYNAELVKINNKYGV